jgi:DNA-binding transcriptional MerR regulator
MSDTPSNIAFRTISEVAELIDVQQHVLRFWESKFEQIQPVKRAAGRRFYRPDDVALIAGIRHALYDQGMTIKGVQKLISDNGLAYIRNLPHELESAAQTAQESGANREALGRARSALLKARELLSND